MIEKREFDLGNPTDHEKLETWLNKKDQYGTKTKKTLVPALQKTFIKLVHELVKNDEVTQYKNTLMAKRIKGKRDAKEIEKQKLREEMESDYVSSETVSTANNSIFDDDEKAFLKNQKKVQETSQDISKDLSSMRNDLRRGSLSPNGSTKDNNENMLNKKDLQSRNTMPAGIIKHDRSGSDEPIFKEKVTLPLGIKKFQTEKDIDSMVFDRNTIEPIKEKNQIFESEGDENKSKKDHFNPVKLLGMI